MLDLSVVTTCRNEERTVGELAEALARQDTDRPWEWVFVDNGSTDGSAAVAEAFRDRLPSLSVVRPADPRGWAEGVNAGIAASRGRKLVIIDADDVPAPNYLRKLSEALDEHEFVSARMDLDLLNPPWAIESRGRWQAGGPFVEYGFFRQAAGTTCGIRRETLERLGGFRPGFAHADSDLCARAHLAGVQLVYVPDAVLHYRLRPHLRAMARQAWSYGRAHAHLERAWAGWVAPSASPVHAAGTAARQLLGIAKVRTKSQLAQWLWSTGVRLGRRYEAWRLTKRHAG